MGHDEREQLQKMFDAHGPEVLLIYVKGACIRKAADIRQKSGVPNSVLALPYELIANGLKQLLEGKKK